MDQSGIAVLACIGALLGGGSPAIAVEANPRPSILAAMSRNSGYEVRVELKGQALVYKADDSREVRIVPTPAQWRAFRQSLDDAGVWSWRPEYSPTVSDAGSWSLHVVYPDRSLKSAGHGGGPARKSVVLYLYAAQQLLGGRRLGARRVEDLELFDLGRLRLIATHPSRIPRHQSANVRDPSGKVHRVRVGSFVGSDYGIVKEVARGSVLLKELVTDDHGDWMERETRMEMQ